MKITASVLVLVLIGMGCGMGCTTAMVKLPNGVRIVQPKDVTFHGLEYAAYPDGSGMLTIDDYTSSANVAAVQAQSALAQGLVETAVRTAITAIVPPVPNVSALPVPPIAEPEPAAPSPAPAKKKSAQP